MPVHIIILRVTVISRSSSGAYLLKNSFMKKINVLSLFWGIECGRVAMDRLGWDIDTYYSSEVDKYPILQTKINFPDIIHLWDVQNIDTKNLKKIDILIWWSPCQDLSTAKSNGKWLDGEKSGLFFEYVRILKECNPKYFLLENVASMKKIDRDKITEIMWVEPILINSSLVSAQNRKRLYWTNIPNIKQPEDKNIMLRDILEDIPFDWYNGCKSCKWKPLDNKYIQKLWEREKYFTVTATYWWACPRDDFEKYNRSVVIWQFRRGDLRIHADQEKSCTLTANMWTGWHNVPVMFGMALRNRWEWKMPEFNWSEKANALTTVQTDSLISDGYFWRKFTPIECERLQTLPDNFTKDLSDSRRYKAIGNWWTVDIIKHILSFCNF